MKARTLDPTLPLKSGEAAEEIARRLRCSKHTASMAIRQWGNPLIRRSRRYTIYSPAVVPEIVSRFLSGDWPNLGTKSKGGERNETH